MKIAVLNITYQTSPSVEPLGSEQMISLFKAAGHDTLLYTTSLDGKPDDADYASILACDGVVFAGISNVRDILDQNYPLRDEMAMELRSRGYGGFIVATGHQASLQPEKTLSSDTALDAVVTGDPDVVAWEIVRLMDSRKPIEGIINSHDVESQDRWDGSVYVNTANHRPYLERLCKIHDPNLLAAVIETSRGCSHSHCSFCSTAALVQRGLKARCALKPVDDIIGEVRYIHDKYGISRFIMEDDFAAPPTLAGAERLEDLAQSIAELPFNIEYSIVIRPDAITDETRVIFADLRETGLVLLYLGIESFDEGDLALYGKNIDFGDLLKGVDIAQELGFKMDISSRYRIKPGLMPFHPYTTLEGIKSQSPYLIKYDITPIKMIAEVELYPGTMLYERARRDGLLAPGTRSGFRYRDANAELFNASMRECLRAMHKERKRIRNMEKTVQGFGLKDDLVASARICRHGAESLFSQAYDALLEQCIADPDSPDTKALVTIHRNRLQEYMHSEEVSEIIEHTWNEIVVELQRWYPDLTVETDAGFLRPCWFPVIH